MIAFLDLGAAYRELQVEIDAAIQRVLTGGHYILGPEVEAFEREWAEYCMVAHCVGVANGLDALILALRSLDVGRGDEVIVPSNTYIATWLAVTAVGARPVPVEPDARTFNMDVGRVEAAITAATRAIIPVHLYGQPANLDPLLQLARRHGVRVIEDAAQAHGARYKGRRIGAHGDVVCWSFYPGKNLGAMGDAGAITTNDPGIADRVRVLRNYGSRLKYVNEVAGVNSRLDPMQAAILRVKLGHLEAWNERRRVLADAYTERLRGTSLDLPEVPDWAHPVWHLYVVRARKRNALQERLSASGIHTLIHYPVPPHMQQAYAALGLEADAFPVARLLANEVLSLPMGPHFTSAQLDEVVACVQAFEA